MINLTDTGKFGQLYHVSSTGAVTAVQYGPGQLNLAKEYFPRGETHYLLALAINVWRKVESPGQVRVIDHDEVPKEIQLYRYLLGE